MSSSLRIAHAVAFLASSLLLSGLAGASPGDEKAPKAGGESKGKSSKEKESGDAGAADSYAVVQVGDEFKVVKGSEIPALRDKVNEDYKETMKKYNEAKKEAAKAKKKFTEPTPVKPTFKVIAQALKDQAAAEKIRQQNVDRVAKAKKKDKEEKTKTK